MTSLDIHSADAIEVGQPVRLNEGNDERTGILVGIEDTWTPPYESPTTRLTIKFSKREGAAA